MVYNDSTIYMLSSTTLLALSAFDRGARRVLREFLLIYDKVKKLNLDKEEEYAVCKAITGNTPDLVFVTVDPKKPDTVNWYADLGDEDLVDRIKERLNAFTD